jgi:hypothetical protein
MIDAIDAWGTAHDQPLSLGHMQFAGWSNWG